MQNTHTCTYCLKTNNKTMKATLTELSHIEPKQNKTKSIPVLHFNFSFSIILVFYKTQFLINIVARPSRLRINYYVHSGQKFCEFT